MWSGNSAFQLLIITAGGKFTGLFVYSGNAPKHGNLVASITAQSGTDPYGNPYAAGITSYDTVFGGVTQINGALIELFAGLNLVQKINPSGYVTYSPNAAAGNVVESVAPAAFTDAYGNAILAGFTFYTTSAPFIAGQLTNNVVQFWTATSQAGPWTANGPSAKFSGALTGLLLSSGTAGGGTAATLQLLNGTISGNVANIIGALAMSEQALPAVSNVPLLFGNTSGHLQAVSDSTNGDSNAYDLERLTLKLAIGSNFTINSTNPQAIFTKALGVGTYEIEVWAVTSNATAADAAGFAFAFTGTASGLVDYEDISGTSSTVTTYTASATFTQSFSSQAVAGNQKLRVNLTVTVTAAGTLTFTGKELVAGNTVTVFGGSRMRICPVVAS